MFRGISRDLNGKRHEGVYLSNKGGLSVIVDDSMKFPGSENNFSSFREIDLFGKEVVFRAFGYNEAGIFKYSDRKLNIIADESVPIPDSQEVFAGALEPKISQGMVVFQGYQHDGKVIHKVIDSKSTIDGKLVYDSNKSLEGFRSRSYDQDYLVFMVKFMDNTRALYMAELPW